MAILSGKRLGPYEILAAIGAGGMGEVYCARDARLDRIVAVKVLPTHLMVKTIEQSARTQINVVLNWIEELKRRVPNGTKK